VNKFFYGVIAVLSVSLFFAGCPTEVVTKTKVVDRWNDVDVDKMVTNETDLRAVLEDAAYKGKNIGFYSTSAVSLTSLPSIPADYTVNLWSPLIVDGSHTLVVEGTVKVKTKGALSVKGTAKITVADGGKINVQNGGTLLTDAETNVLDSVAGITALGKAPGKVTFEPDATLKYTEHSDFQVSAGVERALNYTGVGTLDLGVKPLPFTGAMPSTLADLARASSAKLIAKAGVNESQQTLDIPANATIETNSPDALSNVAHLTVNGKLTAPFVLTSSIQTLVVNGELKVGNSTTFPVLNKASGTGTLVLGEGDFGSKAALLLAVKNVKSKATEISGAIIVPKGNTLTLGNNVNLRGDVTVNGTLNISGSAHPANNVIVNAEGMINVSGSGKSLTINNAELVINEHGVVNLHDQGSLVLAALPMPGAKIIGLGKVVAGKTEIIGGTGGWQVHGRGHSTTIMAGAANGAPNATSISGGQFDAKGAGATIVQLAGSGNSLTIDAGTTIALNGTETSATGSIILTGAKSNPGAIIFAEKNTSVISTGNKAHANAFEDAIKIGGKTFAQGSVGRAVIYTTNDDAHGPFAKLTGSGPGAKLKGGDAGNTIIIDGSKLVD
jgi:hypothetical protein